MKKLLITGALLGAVTAALAQGTVQFSNNALARLSVTSGGTSAQIPLTASYNFGLFFGIGQSTSLQFLSTQLGVNSSSSLGIIANPADRKSSMTAIQLPGTVAGQTDVWIQIRGWESSYGSDWAAAKLEGSVYGESLIRNVGALGPSTGPGLNIWQSAAGTSQSAINAFALTVVPEPTTMALAGLGIASLLIFRRRK